MMQLTSFEHFFLAARGIQLDTEVTPRAPCKPT